MKYYLLGGLFLLCAWCSAQNDTINPVNVASEMPRFPGCEFYTDASLKKKCAEEKLLGFIYQNIVYPDSAIANNIEGTVVLQFVVTKTGDIVQPKILKDIGHGCGEEALRMLDLMKEQNIVWSPGNNNGTPVDVTFNMPVRFKIKVPLPYVVMDGDTIWTEYDQAPSYKEGEEALATYFLENLKYPSSGLDSCQVGVIACELLIRKNGQAIALSMYNYSNLNDDFVFEAIRVVSSTSGKWNIAQLNGEDVAVPYPVRLTFRPANAPCLESVEAFEQANKMSEEGVDLYNAGETESAYTKWTAAIELFPQSVEYQFFRGQAYLQDNKMEEACLDLTAVKAVLGSSGYDELLPLICK